MPSGTSAVTIPLGSPTKTLTSIVRPSKKRDDPQNFNLEDWSDRIGQIIKDIRNPKKPGDFSLGTGFGNAG
jgi:hypothetical protein